MERELKPRILAFEIEEAAAGETIKEYLMKRVGFSSRQLSRFKYRKDGLLLNGEKRYVNAPLKAGDILQIRLTQGGEPVEEHPHDALMRTGKEAGGLPGSSRDDPKHAPKQQGAAAASLERETTEEPSDRGVAAGGPAGYLAARDGRLQKIWAPPAAWLSMRHPLRILYEDEDILAADKPSGVVCHPSPGHFDDTLSNQVAEHLGRTGQELDVRVTGRLDRDTSGIVVFALNTETAAQLIRQRQAKTMEKVYIARVRGHFSGSAPSVGEEREGSIPGRSKNGGEKKECPQGDCQRGDCLWKDCRQGDCPQEDCPQGDCQQGDCLWRGCRQGDCPCLRGTVDLPLKRESEDSFRMTAAPDGKKARTHYRVLREAQDGTTVIACRIEQGRTHQIRVHMKEIGHPIVGDLLYGTKAEQRPLMLHAFRSRLLQPFTGEEILLEAPLPEWALEKEWSL